MPLHVLSDADHRQEDYLLSPPRMRALWHMEDRHFWHAARNAWICAALGRHGVRPPARVLEVGCGSGVVTRALGAAGYRVTGVDTAEPLARKAAERVPRAEILVGRLERLPPEHRGRYDAVGLFDLLEHLDDPVTLLRESVACLAPGGALVATVPGLRTLHGAIDDLSGHRRRFEPGELVALLGEGGLARVHEYGIFRTTVPLLRRFRSRLERRASAGRTLDTAERDALMRANYRVPPRLLNAALGALCALERAGGLGRAEGRPGASLIAVGYAAPASSSTT